MIQRVAHDEQEDDEDGCPHGEEEQHEADEGLDHLKVAAAASFLGLQRGRGLGRGGGGGGRAGDGVGVGR